MSDGIFTINPDLDHTNGKPVQVFLNAECAAIVHTWMRGRDMKSRTAAVDELIRLGAAETALQSMRRRRRQP